MTMRSAEVSQPLRVLRLHQLQLEVHLEMELRRECFCRVFGSLCFPCLVFGFVFVSKNLEKAPRIGSM